MSALDTAVVLALAPDPASAKAGQGLAAARHWKEIGRSDDALWGLCQGSGKDPYQTRVSLVDMATSCSCPSRKFPCKHAIGLMLLGAQGAVPSAGVPDYAAEWLSKRAEKQQKKDEKAQVERTPEQQAKAAAAAERREQSRSERRAEGLADLQLWLCDLVRTGLGSAPVTDAAFWEGRARRLVDAQLPGLGRRLQRCYEHAVSRRDWPEAVLREFAALQLCIEAAARPDLDATERADLDRALGIPQGQDDLDPALVADDDFLCLGVKVETLDTVTLQRGWWWSPRAAHLAMVLSFTPNAVPLKPAGQAGRAQRVRMGWFRSRYPLRASMLEQGAGADGMRPDGHSIADALSRYTDAIAADPWLETLALTVRGRLVLGAAQQLFLCDETDQALPLGTIDAAGWRWLARTRGATAIYSGEWNGERFELLHGWRA